MALDFDALRRVAKTADTDENQQLLLSLLDEWESMSAALRAISSYVVADKKPYWDGDWETTRTRVQIYNICVRDR